MKILVFEENGSKKNKADAIPQYGQGISEVETVSINGPLPDFIEEPQEYIAVDFTADLVLDYLRHPDLSDWLITLCQEKQIPVIAPGKHASWALTPFTCCGMGKHPQLGAYGRVFGFPEYEVELDGDIVRSIKVRRGAPCGATWDALEKVCGASLAEALSLLPREVQFRCSADPAAFDPLTGKSPVHYAGYAHRSALQQAVERARKDKP